MSGDLTQSLPNDGVQLILARLDSIDTRLDSLENRMDTRLTALEERVTAIEQRMTVLEDKVERRLLETRPIWESVLEQLKEVNERLTKLDVEGRDTRRLFRSGFIDLARVQEDF